MKSEKVSLTHLINHSLSDNLKSRDASASKNEIPGLCGEDMTKWLQQDIVGGR